LSTQKHTEFTIEEIKQYLEEIKTLVKQDNYTISINKNRQENMEFIDDYRIKHKKEKEMLLSLEYSDFCYAVDNVKKSFSHEKLYVFCKSYKLDNWGTYEDVCVYIKLNKTQSEGKEYLIVVSFHKLNKEIVFCFEKNQNY